MSRLRRLLANLALTTVSLGLGVLAVELLARVVVSGRAGPGAGANRPIARYHPVLGWDKPPGGEMRITRDEYDVLIRINSKGLRGPERDHAKPPGTRRILMLGDSFAEGYYVDEAASARAVLEAALNAPRACQRYEVINGSTAGWSTDQEYLFFESEGKKYEPDLVVVFFYYNDLYYNTTGIGTGGKPKPYFDLEAGGLVLRNVPVPQRAGEEERVAGLRPWRGSVALRLLSDRTLAGSPRLHDLLARIGLVEPASKEPFREFWPYGQGHAEEVDEMWRRTAFILKALKAAVESAGGRLAVLYVPSRLDVSDEALALTDQRFRMGLRKTRDKVANRLRKTCEILGLPLLDPRAELRRAESEGPRAYFPDDGHWNEAGNAIVARELLGFVKDALPCP